MAPSSATGTASSTMNGSTKLSYCAASVRYTKVKPSPKSIAALPPDSMSSSESPVHSKIIHVNRAHVHLQGIGDLVQRHLQALGLLAINMNQVLRIVGCEARKKSGEVWIRPAFPHQPIRRIRDGLQRVASLILQHKLES